MTEVTKTAKISDIKRTIFVRQEGLVQKRVQSLKTLYGTGVEIDPVIIWSKDLELIDGRHRLAALEDMGIDVVRCVIRDFDTRVDAIAAAYGANIGGAQPATDHDTQFVVGQLIKEKLKTADIVTILVASTGLPAQTVRKYIQSTRRGIKQRAVRKAIRAVSDDPKLSLADAAKRYSVEVEDVQAAMKTKSKRVLRSEQGAPQLKLILGRKSMAFSASIGSIAKTLNEQYTDGGRSYREVQSVLNHAEKLARGTLLRVIEQERRLAALHYATNQKKLAEINSQLDKKVGAIGQFTEDDAPKKTTKTSADAGSDVLAAMGLADKEKDV